ncbi:hypothetical protein ACFFKU_14245 [Kineococcus gynurae]|uniref:Tight adherence protein B n=1 Tax=Kineococcus gynurae TaxID=452979 RepID=A0ABV5LTX9_9ACTN
MLSDPGSPAELLGAVLVGTGLGAAVLVRPGRLPRVASGRTSGLASGATRRATAGVPGWLQRARGRWGGPGTGPRPSVAAGAERVAALLRAGASVETAWGRAGPPGSLAPELRAVRLVVERSGAAPVPALLACATALAEAEDARATVAVATSGARTSARIVGWLPVAGLLLGWLLGAPPWEALLTTPWGRGSALLGTGLLLLGRWWAGRIVGAAQRRVAG